MRKQMTMNGPESLWVVLHVKTVYLQDIPFISRSLGITKRDLFVKGILIQELHWLQMRVELFYHCELLFQEIFDNVSHRYIIWQSDSVTDSDEFSSAGNRCHLQCQCSTETESSTTRGEPELHLLRSLLRLRTLPDDLQGRRYRGLAKVPILSRAIIVQELQQAWHIHVIIVIEMAEPFSAAVEKSVEFHRHFAAKSPPIVRGRALGVDHVAMSLILEVRVVFVGEEPGLILGELEPRVNDGR